jgi:hypothetical protein
VGSFDQTILRKCWRLAPPKNRAGYLQKFTDSTFGQVAAYYAVVVDQGYHFVDTFSKKVEPRLRFGRLLEATEGNQIRVEFYVALTDEACERVDLLRSVKRLLPDVGIIRVKADGRCRDHVHEHGKGDYELAHAKPMLIKILQPARSPKGTE